MGPFRRNSDKKESENGELKPYKERLKEKIEVVVSETTPTKQRTYQLEAIASNILKLDQEVFPELSTEELIPLAKSAVKNEENMRKTIWFLEDRPKDTIIISPYLALLAGIRSNKLGELMEKSGKDIKVIYQPSLELDPDQAFYTRIFTAKISDRLKYGMEMNKETFESIHGSILNYPHGDYGDIEYALIAFTLLYGLSEIKGPEPTGDRKPPE